MSLFQKYSHAIIPSSKSAALRIMEQIYSEDRSKWPYGLNPDGFNGGLYLIREKRAHTPVGFAGWQTRNELSGSTPIKTGFYSIGILPEYRNQGLGKSAVAQLLAKKASTVDCVRALIVEGNTPSLRLASALDVPVLLKKMASWLQPAPF
jgi:RimJ/RimL family protein N-acetyltransferase